VAGVVEKKKVTTRVAITFFCGGVVEKKKATAVVTIVAFFFAFLCGNVVVT
jgi:hypothetical protein